MEQNVRLSHQGLRLLRLLMDRPRESVAGVEIGQKLKIGSGTLYPLLARLESARWLKSEWEDIDPAIAKRPKRRLYTLTALGQNGAKKALDELISTHGEMKWTLS